MAFTNSKPRIGPSGRPLPGPPAARASPSGGSLRGARPLAPPSITSPALRARLPESCAPRAGGAAQCRASAVRLASASLRPGALAAPLWGRQGAFPAVTIFAKQTKAAPVSERRVPRSTTAQSSKPAAGSRAPRLCPRRLPEASASPGETATGSGRSRAAAWRRRGAHREAGGCVRGRARSRGRRQLCGRRWTALKVSETPKAVSPQCPGATPSPLEDPGTMPKFGGNWGQCPVVFLDAGEGLPTSWRTRSRAKCAWGRRNSAKPRGSGTFVGDTERPEIRACPARDWGLRRAAGGPRTMPEIRDE